MTLACLQLSQERMQQQLSQARAACKASESSRGQSDAQHQAQLADLIQQLDTAKQHSADLQELHQQDLAKQLTAAAAVTATAYQQEMDRMRDHYAACLSQHATVVREVQHEVAMAMQEAEDHMADVAQGVTALHQGTCRSQKDLQQQLQQLRLEIASLCKKSTDSSQGLKQACPGLQEVVSALNQIQQQMEAEGCLGINALLQEHCCLKSQVNSAAYHGTRPLHASSSTCPHSSESIKQ